MEKDKRFLVFAYTQYYPQGGMIDMSGSFDTLQEAIDWIKKDKEDNEYHDLYDRISGVDIDLQKYGIDNT